MSITIALGNCPSSGSTFLADLLDSTQVTACGPEINLFAVENLYEFSEFKKHWRESSKFSSPYFRRNSIGIRDIHAYGLSESAFDKLVQESENLKHFLEKFSLHFLSLRGKDLDGAVFEKSPQNLNCIDQYLEKVDAPFIHIVRNPVNVYKSLLKRGFDNSISLITWMMDQARIYNYIGHKNLVVLKYEDLVNDPFGKTADLINRATGHHVDPAGIKSNYEDNPYRKFHTPKLDSWTHNTYGVVGRDRKKELTPEEVESLASLRSVKIGKDYSQIFGQAEVSFMELLEKFGYINEYLESIGQKQSTFQMSSQGRYRLFRKFTGDLKNKDAALRNLNAYLNPVEVF